MRAAYLITSYKLPDQVLRLVRTLRRLSPEAALLVHHDVRQEPLDEAALDEIPGVLLVPPEPVVEWGAGSQLAMFLRSLRFAVANASFDWFTLLSGQDYPIRPLATVERELAQSEHDGFLPAELVPPPRWSRDGGDEFGRRYYYRWRPVREPGALGRRLLSASRPLLALRDLPSGPQLGHRVRSPFTSAMPCRRGPDWFTFNRRCAEVLVRSVRERPALVEHFKRTIVPTEAFTHTILHAEPGLRFSGDPRRYSRWVTGAARPDTLRLADLDAILSSGADFARKFDSEVDAGVLDALDAALGL